MYSKLDINDTEFLALIGYGRIVLTPGGRISFENQRNILLTNEGPLKIDAVTQLS